MQMTQQRSNRRLLRLFAPAMPSWSRGRSARAWGPSSKPCNARIRTGIRATEQLKRTRSKERPRKVDKMFYWLVDLSDKLSVLNVFRYITFRTGGSIITALLFVFMFGPGIIGRLRSFQGKGQPIRP